MNFLLLPIICHINRVDFYNRIGHNEIRKMRNWNKWKILIFLLKMHFLLTSLSLLSLSLVGSLSTICRRHLASPKQKKLIFALAWQYNIKTAIFNHSILVNTVGGGRLWMNVSLWFVYVLPKSTYSQVNKPVQRITGPMVDFMDNFYTF